MTDTTMRKNDHMMTGVTMTIEAPMMIGDLKTIIIPLNGTIPT